MRRFLQFVIVFLIVGIFSLLPFGKSFAQTPPPVSSVNPYLQPNVDKNVPVNLHTWSQSIVTEVMASFVCLLGGVDPISRTHTCLGVSNNGTLGYVPNKGGANGMIVSALDSMYSSNLLPHTKDYLAYMGNEFGVHKSYAADIGIGIRGLTPLINIWIVMRNLAYLLVTIAFAFIGVGVMLRVKIDPRTVMTIENQLPKLIIGLIMSTFSFAIAGILIDLMYIVVSLIFNVYVSIPGIDTSRVSLDQLQQSQPWSAVKILLPKGSIKTPPVHIPPTHLLPKHISVGPIDVDTPLYDQLALPAVDIPQSPISFGEGVSTLAAGGAVAFGDTLKGFLNIGEPSNPSIVDMFLPFSMIRDQFLKGSPVGMVIDIVSWTLSASGANTISDTISKQEVFGVNLALARIPVFLFTFPVLFSAIDAFLRTWAPNVLIFFIIYLAIFLAMARLFFGLVTAWATILYNVVVAPLFIVLGLIPNASGVGFTPWLKSLASNLLAFPVTIGILLLGSALVQSFGPDAANAKDFFIPPLIGGGELPVSLLMALTVIFAASNGPQIAKDMLGEKDNKNFQALGSSAGASLQSVYKAGKATVYGFGKTPQPGQRGGPLTALGQLG